MFDLTNKIEVFIITNGRSTFPYSLRSVESQEGVKFNHTVIENMKWVNANNKILDMCKADYFLRVDDDMLLHPYALSYMWHRISTQAPHIIMRTFLLWEPYKKQRVRGIKVYTHKSANKFKFKQNKLGKIDKVFAQRVKGTSYKIKTDKNVVGIHSCSTVDEHLEYARMRGEHKGPHFGKKEKILRRTISNYKVPLEGQYQMRIDTVNKINRKEDSIFHRYLSGLNNG